MNRLKLFAEMDGLGVFRKGHFKLSPEHHSNVYVDKARVYSRPWLACNAAGFIALDIARAQQNEGMGEIHMVVASTVAGIMFGQVLTMILNETLGHKAEQPEITLAFCECDMPGKKSMGFKRGQEELFAYRQNVLVAKDIFTAGGSTRKVISAVEKLGSNVVGITTMFQRDATKTQALDGRKIMSAFDLPESLWTQEKCPLCAEKHPIEDVSHA